MTIETVSYPKTSVRSNWKRKLLASAMLLLFVLPVKGDETNPLVIKKNPLGLVYTLFAPADLHLE
jgi:hypothetical protein